MVDAPGRTHEEGLHVLDQDVRWCPGCGDYAILAAVQGFMPELGIEPKDMVFVSGIGCSGRFTYYMDTYGFHGIHGRAPAIATGVATANPDLQRLGRDGRRRRAVDRREPPDPRAPAQRRHQDPDVQQPDLRADEGPVLAHVRGGQGHEVDAVRLRGPAVQPGVARARLRGDVRRAARSTTTASTSPRSCARRPPTPAPPSSRSTRTATSSTTARSTCCATSRRVRTTRSAWCTASRSSSTRARAACASARTAASRSRPSPRPTPPRS